MSGNEDSGSCQMVGTLGIQIQLALGLMSFSVLVIKRLCEAQPRPWGIWCLDTSKQGFSQLLAHLANLGMSLFLAGDAYHSDQCLWYLVTNILDNTLGMFFCITILKNVHSRLIKQGRNQYVSGNYYEYVSPKTEENIQSNVSQLIESAQNSQAEDADGNPQLKKSQSVSPLRPQRQESITQTSAELVINYRAWIVQLLVWNLIVIITKATLFAFEFALQRPLLTIAAYPAGWISNSPQLQLFLTIVAVPVLMNSFSFWMQDNFLKKSLPHPPSPLDTSAQSQEGSSNLTRQSQPQPPQPNRSSIQSHQNSQVLASVSSAQGKKSNEQSNKPQRNFTVNHAKSLNEAF